MRPTCPLTAQRDNLFPSSCVHVINLLGLQGQVSPEVENLAYSVLLPHFIPSQRSGLLWPVHYTSRVLTTPCQHATLLGYEINYLCSADMHSTTLHCTASSPGKQRTEDSSSNTISSSTEKGEGQLVLGNLHMLEQIFGASQNIRCLSNVHWTSMAGERLRISLSSCSL